MHTKTKIYVAYKFCFHLISIILILYHNEARFFATVILKAVN